MSHAVVRLRHLFEGADRGLFALPPEVTVARNAVAALKDTTVAIRPGNEEAVTAKLVEYVAANGKVPDGWESQIKPRALEVEYTNAASRILKQARETADDQLLSVTLDLTDLIITDYLRPRLAEAIAMVEPYAEHAVGLPWQAPSRFFTTENSTMLDAIAQANQVYLAIRTGQSVLRETSGSPDSEANLFFGEFEPGIRAIWPSFRTQFQGDPPWGRLEGPGRFTWLVANHAADLWMPTADQVDGAYRRLVSANRLLTSPLG